MSGSSRTDFDTVFLAVGHPILILDPEFRILDANPAMCDLAGLEVEQMRDRHCHQIVHGSAEPPAECPMRRVLASGRLETVEMEMETLGGIFLVSCTPVTGDDGKLEKIIHLATDITKRREMETREKRHMSDLAFLASTAETLVEFPLEENLHEFIGRQVLKTLDGPAVVAVSDYIEEKDTYRPRAVLGVGKLLDRLFSLLGRHPLDIEGDFPESIKVELRKGRLVKTEGGFPELASEGLPRTLLRPIDKLFQFSDVFVLGFVRHGRIYGAVTLLTRKDCPPPRPEVLEALMGQATVALARRKAEEEKQELEFQLRQSQKMEAVGQLAGGIAHDFNNLMMVIGGYTLMLLRDTRRESPHYPALEEIASASDRATRLIRQLLAFSRKQVLDPEVVNVSELIQSMADMLQRLLGEHIRIDIKPDKRDLHIRVDRGQFEQVILNLAVNARHAMPGGGRLTIEIDGDRRASGKNTPPDRVRIRVIDTGHGIPKEDLPRVFEPFFTTKEAGRGTGLGLSTVYGIIKQSGGDIFIRNGRRKGAVAEMIFPATEPVDEQTAGAPPPSDVLRGSETILLVEDEESVRRVIAVMLRRMGYKVLNAGSAEEALDIFHSGPGDFDLLLTDLVMPGLNGLDLAKRLRQSKPGLPVLYMTGFTEDIPLEEGVERGSLPLLEKPFTLPSLVQRIRQVLEN